MVFDKTCPGSRTIREPIPENINCTNCGAEVEIWTDELKATCPKCGQKVYRAQQASCIDWCPHAKECVGPEAYERLRPGVEEDMSGADSPLAVLEREHVRALEVLGLLRGASLCLRLGELSPESPVHDRGMEHLGKVLEFFEKDLKLHFQREEEVLFSVLEKYVGTEKSPTRLLLEEHNQVWRYYDQLKERLVELQGKAGEPSEAYIQKVQGLIHDLGKFLQEHIRKEDESLFPLAKSLVPQKELEGMPEKLRALSR